MSCLACAALATDEVLVGDAALAAPPFAQPEATPTVALNEAEPAPAALKQVELDRSALDEEAVQVRGYLCFVAADWPLFDGSFATRGVTALWPKKLAGVITQPGPLTEDEIGGLHERLAKAFPVA